MKQIILLISFIINLLMATSCKSDKNAADNGNQIDVKVKELLSKMTLDEKAGQMTQVIMDVLTIDESPFGSKDPLSLDTNTLKIVFGKYPVGSVLNTANIHTRNQQEWSRLIYQIQEYSTKNIRLKIPVLFGINMIHGASCVSGTTLFPQQIGMAATWNPTLIKRAGEIIAYETRAMGCPWTFSPVLDLGLDPRWPGQWETFGEDPLLAANMGEALIQGLQGDDNNLSHPNNIAACMRHYLGYSQSVGGNDHTPALIPMNMLREYHLPAFRKAVETGALTVMVNSGGISGLPEHASHQMITELLKQELGFKGFVISDWGGNEYLHTRYKIAANQKEAVKTAINAGIDMFLVPYNSNFTYYLVELVNEGEIPMSRIDDAVSRILNVKLLLGLFEQPLNTQENYPDFASGNFASDARRTALESITLLKNEHNLLPLPSDAGVLVCGPAANSMWPLIGGWSYSRQGNLVNEFTGNYVTIYEAMKSFALNPAQVILENGVTYRDTGDFRNEQKHDLSLILNKAKQVDYIVVCAGENSNTEIPGNLTTLDLSENQQELIKVAASSGKPIILVLVQGRPRLIREVEPLAGAILDAYLPGNYGGEALARILFGESNPSGKLPYTYPKYSYSIEPYYHKSAGTLTEVGNTDGSGFDPQYEFGFGLSYAQFSYSDLKLDKTSYKSGENIKVKVNIHNNSGKAGMEVVQVYVSDHFASNTPTAKRLRAFTKIMLQPGESRELELEFPVNALAFVNQKNETLLEKGEFTLIINTLKQLFKVTEDKAIGARDSK